MRRTKCLISVIVILTMAVVIFTACGQSSSAPEPAKSDSTSQTVQEKKTESKTEVTEKSEEIRIGMVLKAINSDYWKIVEAGAKDAEKELGVKVDVLGPNAETDIAGQTSIMEDQIIKKVSALVVAPSQPSAAIAIFDKADEAGIPVLLIDTNADWDKKKTFIGTGNLAGGEEGGKFVASKLQKGDKVVILRGALGDGTHDERTNGAQKAMEDAGLVVAAVQPANSERNTGMSVMENLLQSHPDVKGVFCTNDEMALGALRAIQQAGKEGVVVVGFDGSPDAMKSIKAGELTASVAQSPYNIGKFGVEAAVKVSKGESIEQRIDTGTIMITKENVDAEAENLGAILGKKVLD